MKASKFGNGQEMMIMMMMTKSVPDKPLGSSDAQSFAPNLNCLKQNVVNISWYIGMV